MLKIVEKLEAILTTTPADRGSYCSDCGGLSIEDAINALHTLDHQGTVLTVDEANAVFDGIAEGEEACRRCGEPTLAGALRDDMLAADEQK